MRAVLSISLPETLAAELTEFAHEMGRNKSDIVKESISLFLWEARFNKTRKSLAGKAKKQGIVSEDDLFRSVS
jgi:metal-responsive CopG/Arc/MetJ family transcriptional regulator